MNFDRVVGRKCGEDWDGGEKRFHIGPVHVRLSASHLPYLISRLWWQDSINVLLPYGR